MTNGFVPNVVEEALKEVVVGILINKGSFL
jgi:hypothetical protein